MLIGSAKVWDRGGKQAVNTTWAQLPSVSVSRDAAVAESDGLQSGEPVAAVGTAEEDR